MPPRSSTALAAALSAAIATACAHPPMDDTPKDNLPPERPNETQPGAKPPVPKRNARAVPYDISLALDSAPGPFAQVRAAMVYRVEDERCLPRLGGMSGTRVTARQFIEIGLDRTGPETWRGRFHDQLLVDDDYYGLGTCRWRLSGVSVEMRATGADGETRFSEFLFPEDLAPGKRTRAYFVDRHYPRADVMDDFPASGERDIGRFKPEARERLFSLDVEIAHPGP